MTEPLYLTRVRISPETGAGRVIRALKKPGRMGDELALAHHLVWALFPGLPDCKERPFLYRDDGDGRYIVLSRGVEPKNEEGLFEMDGPKEFAPSLTAGDRLRFRLRANPVARRRDERLRINGDGTPRLDKKGRPQRVSKKDDVVMQELKSIPDDKRRAERADIIQQAGRAWLQHIAKDAGFSVDPSSVLIDHYRQHRHWRKRGQDCQRFSTLDFEGVLEVSGPSQFLDKLAMGFGSAKAFGCGLMLIRRA